MLSVTAIAAFCTTIGVGNYGVILVALLVGAYQAQQTGLAVLPGLLMGVALLKPQLSGPLALPAISCPGGEHDLPGCCKYGDLGSRSRRW